MFNLNDQSEQDTKIIDDLLEALFCIFEMKTNGDIELLQGLVTEIKHKKEVKSLENDTKYYFPASKNTQWEDITIKFKDGHIASVSCKDQGKVISKVVDFHTMNMSQYNREISKAWKLLEKLAEYNGFLKPCNYCEKNLKKQKSLLSKKLKEYFQLDDNPIDWDYKRHGYKTKFKICYKE